MPFERLIPRPLTPGAVRTYAPVDSGVYGISNAREWIYIGAADNIQRALEAHLVDFGSSLMRRAPTGFVFEVCKAALRPARQDRLVLEYAPTCNRPLSRSLRPCEGTNVAIGSQWFLSRNGLPRVHIPRELVKCSPANQDEA